MSTQIGDLWPQLEEPTVRTPSSILKEQASALGRRTNGLVVADVSLTKVLGNNNEISYRFVLVAPALDDYRYELFAIRHPITLYPIHIEKDKKQAVGAEKLNNEQEFVDWLRAVFNSDQTKKIISSLISQSK